MAINSINYRGKKLKFSDNIPARVSHFHKKGKIYESRMLEYIRGLNKKGAYIDVGANIGNHSVFFALFCKTTGVFAIEPITEIYDTLNENIVLNNCKDKIKSLHVAASSKSGKVGINYVKGKLTETTFEKRKNMVDAITLDSLITSISKVAIIKIDVEGFEEQVLLGSKKILERDHPDLFIESHTKQERDAIQSIITPFGYKAIKLFNASPTYHYACQETSKLSDLILVLKRFRGFRKA